MKPRKHYPCCPNCGMDMDEGLTYCSLTCWAEFVADPAGAWINQAF